MEKVFDAHIHHNFAMPLQEAIEIYKEEFVQTGTVGGIFLSLPHHAPNAKLTFNPMQNIRILYLKHAFSPDYFAFAGLEHPLSPTDDKTLADLFLKQAETYMAAGYDGMKMLEGYPSMRKVMQRKLCDKVYDKFYSFLEENNVPVTLHLANPEDYWDAENAPASAVAMGRVCDETYPTKAELHEEVESVMKKHPKLRLTLAHFGFMSYNVQQARRWLDDYENTLLDTTPGGEQHLKMRETWEEEWLPFFEDKQDRIVYGSDFYAFPRKEDGSVATLIRSKFQREFFETDEEHTYLDEKFRGVKLDEKIRTKIYSGNAKRLYGTPKKIDLEYMRKEAERLLKNADKTAAFADEDLKYILEKI